MSEQDGPRCTMHHHQNPDDPRPVEHGALICPGHIKQSRRTLEILPAIYEQLATVAIHANRQTGARGAEKPIPYREGAADLRFGGRDHDRDAEDQRGIREVVVGWACVVAEERNVTLPQSDGTNDVPLACEFLRRHHDWAVGQDWAPDYATELHDLERKARPILQPTITRRVDVPVPCPLCHGRLKAVVGQHDATLKRDDLPPPVVTCEDCGEQVPFDEAQRIARTMTDQAVLTLGPACDLCPHPSCKVIRSQVRMVTWDDAWLWATGHDYRLQAPTLRKWAERGHVRTIKAGRVVLYSLPDVQKQLGARLSEAS